MSLISPGDQEKLREAFNAMTSDVRLVFFTQTLGCETCPQTRQILDELPPLSSKITIEEVNLVLEGEKAKQYGVDRPPAIVLLSEDKRRGAERGVGVPAEQDREAGAPGVIKDSRIRFLGTPAGYEFISLIQAILLVGGRAPGLTEENRRRVSAVAAPVTLQVFTTPT